MNGRHRERGGALVEFAIVAPFVCMLFFGAIQFGIVMYWNHTVDYAAAVGARWAAVRGASCSNTSVCPVGTADVQTYVRSVVPGLDAPATVTTTWIAPPSTWAVQPASCASGSNEVQGCIVNVVVSKPITFVIPFVTGKSLTLSGTSQAVIQF